MRTSAVIPQVQIPSILGECVASSLSQSTVARKPKTWYKFNYLLSGGALVSSRRVESLPTMIRQSTASGTIVLLGVGLQPGAQ